MSGHELNCDNLANAIILQAVKDYRGAQKRFKGNPHDRDVQVIKEIDRFFRSEWFKILTNVDGERLIRSLQEEVGA